jgi:hypothetical protein
MAAQPDRAVPPAGQLASWHDLGIGASAVHLTLS